MGWTEEAPEGERSKLSELHLELNLQDQRWAGHGGGGEGKKYLLSVDYFIPLSARILINIL